MKSEAIFRNYVWSKEKCYQPCHVEFDLEWKRAVGAAIALQHVHTFHVKVLIFLSFSFSVLILVFIGEQLIFLFSFEICNYLRFLLYISCMTESQLTVSLPTSLYLHSTVCVWSPKSKYLFMKIYYRFVCGRLQFQWQHAPFARSVASVNVIFYGRIECHSDMCVHCTYVYRWIVDKQIQLIENYLFILLLDGMDGELRSCSYNGSYDNNSALATPINQKSGSDHSGFFMVQTRSAKNSRM